MLASLIVLTIILASLLIAPSAAVQRSDRRMRFERMGLAAKVRWAGRSGSAARSAEVAFIRSDSWRYYGFSLGAPEADAAVVVPACVADELAIGSIVTTLPDDSFVTVVNGRAYRRCGHVWFQPQYIGSDVSYVVVRAP